MKRWKKGLLLSLIWLVVTIGAAILHTSVIMAGRLTPEQDDAISGRYGIACGFGLGMIWLFLYLLRKPSSP